MIFLQVKKNTEIIASTIQKLDVDSSDDTELYVYSEWLMMKYLTWLHLVRYFIIYHCIPKYLSRTVYRNMYHSTHYFLL